MSNIFGSWARDAGALFVSCVLSLPQRFQTMCDLHSAATASVAAATTCELVVSQW